MLTFIKLNCFTLAISITNMAAMLGIEDIIQANDSSRSIVS